MGEGAPLPGDVFLLEGRELLRWEAELALELAQRRLAGPHAMCDGLNEQERLLGEWRPVAAQADVKQAAHEARCALADVDHVRHQSEALELEA